MKMAIIESLRAHVKWSFQIFGAGQLRSFARSNVGTHCWNWGQNHHDIHDEVRNGKALLEIEGMRTVCDDVDYFSPDDRNMATAIEYEAETKSN